MLTISPSGSTARAVIGIGTGVGVAAGGEGAVARSSQEDHLKIGIRRQPRDNLAEALRDFAQYRMIVYALLLVVMMIVRPQGLFTVRTRGLA